MLERRDRFGRGTLLFGFPGQPIADCEHRREQVQVVAGQSLDPLATHQVRDEDTHIAALGDVAGAIAEASHQFRPNRAGGTGGVPAELRRLSGKAVAGE